jgi:uncharacterized iron-regulated membrane protein
LSAVIPSASIVYGHPRLRLRTLIRRLHQAIGLSFGLILATQGLSEAVLVWRPGPDRLLLPNLTHSPTLGPRGSLNAELAAVCKVAPSGEVRMVRIAETADGTDVWTFGVPGGNAEVPSHGSRVTVYVSPHSAEVVGIRGPQRDAIDLLVELHHNLLMGRLGRAVLGYLAIATMLLAVSGLWSWWPARWTASRIRPRAAAKPLHLALGFWTMWPLLIIATTALYFIWKQPIQKAFGVSDSPPAARRVLMRRQHRGHEDREPNALPTNAASLDFIVAAAVSALPGEQIVALHFPEKPGDPFTIFFAPAGQHYRAAPDTVIVQALPDGRAHVDHVLRWRQLPFRKRLLEWLPRIHQAESGGTPIQVLWSVTGCMPAVLYVSGFMLWRRRIRAAKRLSLQPGAR